MTVIGIGATAVKSAASTFAGVGAGMLTYTKLHNKGTSDVIAVPTSAAVGVGTKALADATISIAEAKVMEAKNRQLMADLEEDDV